MDEVLDFLKLSDEKRKQVKRCLINDLNPQAVERAIERLRENRVYSFMRFGISKSKSGLAIRY